MYLTWSTHTISLEFPFLTDTTDVQSVTVVPGKTDARVTCNYAIGSSCQACQLNWRDINSGVSSAGKTAMRMGRDSRTATTTISPLTPGHTYSITAADFKGGKASSIEVTGENFTTAAQGQYKLTSWWWWPMTYIFVVYMVSSSQRDTLYRWASPGGRHSIITSIPRKAAVCALLLLHLYYLLLGGTIKEAQ